MTLFEHNDMVEHFLAKCADLSSVVSEYEEYKQDLAVVRWYCEEVNRHQFFRKCVEECGQEVEGGGRATGGVPPLSSCLKNRAMSN